MSDTIVNLRRQITSAGDLQSVVRTMKALAATSIGQYEQAVIALTDYSRTVELGLHVCLHECSKAPAASEPERKSVDVLGAIVFGSDQGLVGQFNDVIADYAVKTLAALPLRPKIWAVGERVHERLADAGLPVQGIFDVPNSVKSITPLIGQILLETENLNNHGQVITELYLFYNSPESGTIYAPIDQRLLPLDEIWSRKLTDLSWPTKNLPQVIGGGTVTMRALIHEYLFVSLFRACTASLASENSSRLAAMQRAEKNIDELLEELSGNFYRLRQSDIDEELFDLVAGFEALGAS